MPAAAFGRREMLNFSVKPEPTAPPPPTAAAAALAVPDVPFTGRGLTAGGLTAGVVFLLEVATDDTRLTSDLDFMGFGGESGDLSSAHFGMMANEVR